MRDAERYAVWGASGSGKSAYAKAVLWDRRKLIVFDPNDEYTERARGIPGLKRCKTLNEILEGMQKNWPAFRLQYSPPASQEAQTLSALCNMLMTVRADYRQKMNGPHITLLIDELHLSFPSHGGVEKCPGFAKVCSTGRHYGLEVWGVSQRVTEVHPRFRGNVAGAVVFEMPNLSDAKAAGEIMRANHRQIMQQAPLNFHERFATKTRRGFLTFRKNVKKAIFSYLE
jgi:hypothetical protein